MKAIWIVTATGLVIFAIAGVLWLGARPEDLPGTIPAASVPQPGEETAPLRIGLVPERDIFEMRARHKALTGYLSAKLGRPVEVALVNTYLGVLQDFAERRIDAAFLGSLVAVLAVDRLNVELLVKPVREDGGSTYHGVLFVKDGSPVRRVEDLGGRSVALIQGTLAGDLFPMSRMFQAGLLNAKPPLVMWIGTHDDVIIETLSGRVDAGAAMNLRLEAYEAAHPDARFRRIAQSAEVPHDALAVRRDVAPAIGQKLKDAMLAMDKDPEGAKALAVYGAKRYVPTSIEEYGPVYDMIEALGDQWSRLEIDGPAPKRPPAVRP
jgi:phosphonate transport system substrate-binding protein